MDSIIEKDNVPFPQKSDRELLEDMQQRLIKMEKRSKCSRIFAWGLSLLLIFALVLSAVSLAPQLKVMKAQYDTLSETVQQLAAVFETVDVQKLQEAVDFIAGVDYEKLVELNDMLEGMDAQQLKEQLEQMSTLLGELDELNTEALVENINLIIERLAPVMNWLR